MSLVIGGKPVNKGFFSKSCFFGKDVGGAHAAII